MYYVIAHYQVQKMTGCPHSKIWEQFR